MRKYYDKTKNQHLLKIRKQLMLPQMVLPPLKPERLQEKLNGFKTCHFPIIGPPPFQGSNSLSIIIYRIQTRRGTFKEQCRSNLSFSRNPRSRRKQNHGKKYSQHLTFPHISPFPRIKLGEVSVLNFIALEMATVPGG